jgi:HK97 family phage prohead protease
MTIERKCIPFEIKAVSEPSGPGDFGSFEGVGSAFHNIDSAFDIVAPGAFVDDIPRFLKEGFIGGLNHNWDSPIGHPVWASEIPAGLSIKGVFDDTPEAQSVRAKMRPNKASGRATIQKFSIGYRTLESEPLRDPEAVRSYWKSAGYSPAGDDEIRLKSAFAPRRHPQTGKDFTPGVRLLKKLSLYEVSPVSVPANDRAVVTGAKALPAGDDGDDSKADAGMLGDPGRAVAYSAMRTLHEMLCMALYGIVGNDMLPVEGRLALVAEVVDQFRDALVEALRHFLGSAPDDDEAAAMAGEAVETMARQFKARFPLGAGESESSASLGAVSAPGFADQSRSVVSAVGVFVDRADARIEARVKDGRELSAANRAALRDVHDGLMGHVGKIRDMLGRSEREKPKAIDPPPDAAPPQPQPQPEAKAATRVDPAVVKALLTHRLDTRRAALMVARSEGK